MPLPLILGPLLELASKVIDRVVPDKAAAEKAKLEMAATLQSQEYQLLIEQIRVNAAEASSTSWFVAGWRPFVGWVCGAALAYTYIVLPFLQFFVYSWGAVDTINKFSRLPKLDLTDLLPILLGMLGLGIMRTYEKSKDAEANR